AKRKVIKKAAKKKNITKNKAVKKAITVKPAIKKIVHTKPIVHKVEHKAVKIEKPVVKEVLQAVEVIQQEASHSGDHRESFVPHVTSLKEGDVAPYFMGTDQHGNLLSLNDFHGKTLVLYFYPKDDTDGCTAESCSLRDEYQYLTMQNHAVVGVSADDVESHKKFAEKFNLPFSLIADINMDIIKAYDVWGRKRLFDHIYDGIVRTTFIIKDNKIARVITSVNTKNHGKQVMEG
ncbi:MAG TPA: peroxiredoxin, partial [Bacteroidia bacterium]|nr:peroxiredoxin [Bacteroidia bacterium]